MTSPAAIPTQGRRFPVGAEVLGDGTVDFRVWAPRRRSVAVVVDGIVGESGQVHPQRPRSVTLHPEPSGYFAGTMPDVVAGACYRYRLDGGDAFPDPASRWQPDGPHGPSAIVDPTAFRWTDVEWPGVESRGQVIYEVHIGTFTREGTWRAAAGQLAALAELGITLIEVMPVADFAGRFGWGYDGVNLFAPSRLYGTPDDMRRFVDRAHAAGLGVILDVVYNHLGPSGNYLGEFSEDYVTARHHTDWGPAINFEGEGSAGVREFYLANAAYWIEEFHLDGLRMDATQNIYDSSPTHILADVASAVRRASGGRTTFVVAENESQEARIVRSPESGGYGLDALWNDDFHHSAMVALTGRNEAYYTDYRGSPQEFVSAVRSGFLYQGQWYHWQAKRRGTPARDLPPERFVNFIQNHDQVANSFRGDRVDKLTSPGRLRALTALLLLAPQTPMLFQGQEFAASAPFLYFADHDPDLMKQIRDGRATFLAQFPSLDSPEIRAALPDPGDPQTFEQCKLDHAERETHAAIYTLHRDLITLRRTDPSFRTQRRGAVDGAVLPGEAFILRWPGEGGADRVVIVNLGGPLHLDPAPEPLVAPPEGGTWIVHLSTDDPVYGGIGRPPLEGDDSTWRIPGECALVLIPASDDDD